MYDEHGFYTEKPVRSGYVVTHPIWDRVGESLVAGNWEITSEVWFVSEAGCHIDGFKAKNLKTGEVDETFDDLWTAMEWVEDQL